MKTCPKCGRALPASAFYRSRREVDGLQHQCKDCKRTYNAANAESISKRHRNYLQARPGWKPRPPVSDVPPRFRKYGITQGDFDRMREAQDARCAICQRPESERALVIDHDHQTGEVRGLLCSFCNIAIGMLGDTAESLGIAAAYLGLTPTMDGLASSAASRCP